MGLRSRTRTSDGTRGTAGSKFDPYNPGPGPIIQIGQHTCDDYVASAQDGWPLDIEHSFMSGGRINLPWKPNSDWFNNYIATGFQTLGMAHLSTGAISDGVAAAKGQAGSNPSKPFVDIGVFIGEMRDIPRLLRIEGNNIIQRAGSANLQYQFGWAPFVSDLVQFTRFQTAVHKRMRELRRMQTRGLRRTIVVDNRAVSSTAEQTVQSFYRIIKRWTTVRTTEKVWVHTRWRSTLSAPSTDDELLAMARRAAGGLTLDGSTAWNLIPWSFLVDWGFSFGNFLAANRNLVSATCSTPLVMREQYTTKTAEAGTISGAHISAYNQTRISRRRRSASASPFEASLPILTNRQTSILGSIGVTRRFPR